MPRGKKALSETSDLEIIKSDKEEGNIPYFLIDDDYGIACDERQEILVHKRIANRTVKNSDKEYIEQYVSWDSLCYPSNFTNAISCYVERKGRELNKKIKKTKDIQKIIDNQNELKHLISTSLNINGINKEFLSITSILDERTKLEEELKMLKQTKDNVLNECEKLIDLVKEKRSIIIKETEPKKHRLKLEKD